MRGIFNIEAIYMHKLVIIIIIILLIMQYNISRQTKMATFTETARQVPRHIVYGRNLRRLSTACAFMSPENVVQHIKVFLAIRNLLIGVLIGCK